jgi:hypothetical protein
VKGEGGHTDEFVDPETDFVEKSRRLIIIVCLGGSLGFLLDRLLDVEGLGSEFLGLSSIVSDKDVVDCTLGLSLPLGRYLHKISSVMVQSSIPIPAIFVKSDGELSSKKAGLEICRGAHSPL